MYRVLIAAVTLVLIGCSEKAPTPTEPATDTAPATTPERDADQMKEPSPEAPAALKQRAKPADSYADALLTCTYEKEHPKCKSLESCT
ncbi:MAG: hypothetical protein VYE15_05690, partial [Myxococcota bacterium]|nr:hypothetical protein [Myxococcota bacterium]